MTEPRPCMLQAWAEHEAELHAFLRARCGDEQLAEDLLQDVFLKALRQGDRFCEVRQARAWLYRVARNALVDRHRVTRPHEVLGEPAAPEMEDPPPVLDLLDCLPRALEALSEADADIIRRCDLEGMSQADYARQHGLSLPGARSRIQRARRRLKAQLTRACQVRFDESGQVCCVEGPTD
ncbi:MAG: sigma-70 family RNA polymerase sigma factor [Deltaproteobacteria bacterium]|nr:MAG: sigma-70 family RNA polymerase sigma factor [Deltaproteobacteria bacterium]